MEPDPLGMQGGARLYNPQTGRFFSAASLGFTENGTNLYAYVSGNPISNLDPNGLANLNLFNSVTDPVLYGYANDWNPRGVYSVAGHGDYYENGDFAGTLAGLTPQQLAARIKKDPTWKGQPVEIRGCGAGKGGKQSFAQQLANILGTQVKAPTTIGQWNGISIPSLNFYMSLGVSFPDGGSFQVFSSARN